MAQHPFPDPGHDGDEPAPGDPARDWAEEDDRYLAWLTGEVEAGRIEVPPDEPSPGVTVSLGEAGDAGLEELAALASGLAGTGFAGHEAADVMPPGPVLGALTSQAAEDLASLGDDELLGVVLAARRLQARDEYLELAAIAEFARRREEIIYEFTRYLSGERAAQADQILAAAAPGMAPAGLKQKAARLEYKLDPDGVRQRKEEAARKHRRVEARREDSGNARLSGRELDVDEALTAKNSVWAEAAALCNAGLDVSLREARTIVYLDRLRGLDPWDRLSPPYDPDDPGDDEPEDPGSDEPDDHGIPADPGDGDADEHGGDRHDGDDTGRFPDYGYDAGEDGDDGDDGEGDGGGGPSGAPGRPGSPAGKAPLPALTNITISAGTLLGWSDAPAEVAGFGLLGPGSARDLIAAASRHPRTRWCVTVLGEDGEATAHGCASGRHPWTPATARAGPDDNQRAQLAALLRQLGIAPAPIAKGTCDHRQRENRYRPGRKLSHLIRARTTTCSAPGCNAQAIHSELDHTVPYPAGPSDECNLAPPCKR